MKKIFLVSLLTLIGWWMAFCNNAFAWNTNVWLVILESGVVFTGNTNTFFNWSGSTSTGGNNTWNTFTGWWNGGWGNGWGNVIIAPPPIIPIFPISGAILPPPTTGIVLPPLINTWIVLTGENLLPAAWDYDPELTQAYEFAKAYGITSMPTIQEARLYSNITRAEFAKMISVMAIRIHGKEVTTVAQCALNTYIDVPSSNREAPYIAQVCSMWIMWWLNNKSAPIQYFRPDAYITRAEIWTVLSRYLYGDQYNWDASATYYEKHLSALQDAWIIKKIDEPEKNEFRGYVMLMLQRLAK